MRIYDDGTNIPFLDNNDRPQYRLVITRVCTEDETRWPMWNADKTDIILDTDAKAAWENSEKPTMIQAHTSQIIDALRKSDHTELPSFSYPNDKPLWDAFRAQLKTDMAALSGKTYAQLKKYVMPTKPF